jgi:hypothetical protein
MKVINELKPSTVVTLKGPHMSVRIISKTPELHVALLFLMCFINFPLIHSMQWSKSLKSSG